MRRMAAIRLLAVCGCLTVIGAASESAGAASSNYTVKPAALAKAARRTPLSALDANGAQCGNERTVEAWLVELGGGDVASIRWSGGACRLVREENPLDAGGAGAACGRAEMRLKHPASAADRPKIEVYFETSRTGALSPYAFRGVVRLADGEEYTRFTGDFESAWRSRFPAIVANGADCAE